MLSAPFPHNEKERLELLHALELLDSPPEVCFDRITRLVARTLGVPIALVSLVDEERQWFKSRIGIDATETPRDISFCSHTIVLPRPLVVADAQQDERFFDNPLVAGAPHIRFYAGVPIVSSAGLPLGTLCAVDQQPRELSTAELETLCDLAEILSQEVQQRELLLHARTQLQKSGSLLLNHEARYRAMFELALVGIAIVAPDGAWLSINNALCEIVGYTPDELMQVTFRDITHPADLNADLAQLQRLARGEIEGYQLEKRYLRKNGQPIWVALSVTRKSSEDGEPEYYIAIVKDIQARKEAEQGLLELKGDLERKVVERTAELTDANQRLNEAILLQRQATQALRKREAQLSSIIEMATEAFISLDQQGRVTAWNPQAETIFGWSAAEVLGAPLEQLIVPPEAVAEFQQALQIYLREGQCRYLNQRRETLARRRDGTPLVVEVCVYALNIDGEQSFSAFLHDITERKRLEAQREREASRDALTGLLNRRAMNELLPLALARADRSGQQLAVLFIDLDGFKAVNDTFGHDGGDRLLQVIGERLSTGVRCTDSVIRPAGDEFIVVLEGLSEGTGEAKTIAEKLLAAIREPVPLADESARVGASIGVSIYRPGSGQDMVALVQQADALMYRAKQNGKGYVAILPNASAE